MSKKYKNLKLHEVNYGFGFRFDGDMSTHPLGNVLDSLDYRFSNIINENNKLNNKVDKLTYIVEKLMKMEVYEYEDLAVKQEVEEIYKELKSNE